MSRYLNHESWKLRVRVIEELQLIGRALILIYSFLLPSVRYKDAERDRFEFFSTEMDSLFLSLLVFYFTIQPRHNQTIH